MDRMSAVAGKCSACQHDDLEVVWCWKLRGTENAKRRHRQYAPLCCGCFDAEQSSDPVWTPCTPEEWLEWQQQVGMFYSLLELEPNLVQTAVNFNQISTS